MARLLVEWGATVDAGNEWDRTPLHLAAGYGHVELIRELVSLGADLNWRDEEGQNTLHTPAFLQRVECLEVLLEAGADVTAQDNEGNTPLHVAAGMNRREAARVLVGHGADLEALNGEGFTPMDVALVNVHSVLVEHNSDVAEYLLSQGSTLEPERLPVSSRHLLWPDMTPPEMLTPEGRLHPATMPELTAEQVSQLPAVGQSGIPPFSTVAHHGPLLSDAVRKGKLEFVRALLDRGVIPRPEPAYHFHNAFLIAIEDGDLPMVRLFLEYQKIKKGSYWTDGEALYRAYLGWARNRDKEIVRELWQRQVGIYQLLRSSGAEMPEDHCRRSDIKEYFDQEPDWEWFIRINIMAGVFKRT